MHQEVHHPDSQRCETLKQIRHAMMPACGCHLGHMGCQLLSILIILA